MEKELNPHMVFEKVKGKIKDLLKKFEPTIKDSNSDKATSNYK